MNGSKLKVHALSQRARIKSAPGGPAFFISLHCIVRVYCGGAGVRVPRNAGLLVVVAVSTNGALHATQISEAGWEHHSGVAIPPFRFRRLAAS